MTIYDINWTENVTNVQEYATEINTMSGFLFFSLLMFGLLFILFVVFRRFGTDVALLGSSFIVSIVGGLFWTLNYIGFNILIFPILLLIISIIYYMFVGDG